MVAKPKIDGGLGMLDLKTQNEALLLKSFHKFFFNKANIPWVKLIWEKHYSNNRLPNHTKKGPFWWRDILKLLHKYKGFLPLFFPMMVPLVSCGMMVGMVNPSDWLYLNYTLLQRSLTFPCNVLHLPVITRISSCFLFLLKLLSSILLQQQQQQHNLGSDVWTYI